MKERNFSLNSYWQKVYENYKPELEFSGESVEEWQEWRGKAYKKLLEVLGNYAEKAPLSAEVECSNQIDGLIRERVVFNVDEFASIPCLVVYPADMKPDGSNPAILCIHGHGPYGKSVIAGVRDTVEQELNMKKFNYNYGEYMAKAGFLTISPDLRIFSERRDGRDPFPGLDACNVNFFKGTMLGMYLMSLNVWDMMRCIDYLETRPEVDNSRIGMMGLSLGGAVTTFTAAVDERIKAASISGYAGPWTPSIVERSKTCGSQFIPEIGRYLDTHDIAGLIAPRPLLYEIGRLDKSSPFNDAIVSYAHVKKVYKASGHEDKLFADIHKGGHIFANNIAREFFCAYL